MKHAIWGFFMVLITLVLILIISTAVGRMQRSSEATSTLAEAVEQSVDTALNDKSYTINNTDEFIGDVLQNLISSYENDAQITVKIVSADKEKGLIGLNVTEKFRKADGSEGEESYDKIVLLETDEEGSTCEISYLLADNSVFQIVTSNVGESIPLPDNSSYTKWNLVNSDGSQTLMTTDEIKNKAASGNMTFIAAE